MRLVMELEGGPPWGFRVAQFSSIVDSNGRGEEIVSDGLAHRAGLRIGDVINRLQGFTPSLKEIQRALGSYSTYDAEKGQCSLKLEIIRSAPAAVARAMMTGAGAVTAKGNYRRHQQQDSTTMGSTSGGDRIGEQPPTAPSPPTADTVHCDLFFDDNGDNPFKQPITIEAVLTPMDFPVEWADVSAKINLPPLQKRRSKCAPPPEEIHLEVNGVIDEEGEEESVVIEWPLEVRVGERASMREAVTVDALIDCAFIGPHPAVESSSEAEAVELPQREGISASMMSPSTAHSHSFLSFKGLGAIGGAMSTYFSPPPPLRDSASIVSPYTAQSTATFEFRHSPINSVDFIATINRPSPSPIIQLIAADIPQQRRPSVAELAAHLGQRLEMKAPSGGKKVGRSGKEKINGDQPVSGDSLKPTLECLISSLTAHQKPEVEGGGGSGEWANTNGPLSGRDCSGGGGGRSSNGSGGSLLLLNGGGGGLELLANSSTTATTTTAVPPSTSPSSGEGSSSGEGGRERLSSSNSSGSYYLPQSVTMKGASLIFNNGALHHPSSSISVCNTPKGYIPSSFDADAHAHDADGTCFLPTPSAGAAAGNQHLLPPPVATMNGTPNTTQSCSPAQEEEEGHSPKKMDPLPLPLPLPLTFPTTAGDCSGGASLKSQWYKQMYKELHCLGSGDGGEGRGREEKLGKDLLLFYRTLPPNNDLMSSSFQPTDFRRFGGGGGMPSGYSPSVNGTGVRRSKSQSSYNSSSVLMNGGGGGGGRSKRYDPVADMEIIDRWSNHWRRMSRSSDGYGTPNASGGRRGRSQPPPTVHFHLPLHRRPVSPKRKEDRPSLTSTTATTNPHPPLIQERDKSSEAMDRLYRQQNAYFIQRRLEEASDEMVHFIDELERMKWRWKGGSGPPLHNKTKEEILQQERLNRLTEELDEQLARRHHYVPINSPSTTSSLILNNHQRFAHLLNGAATFSPAPASSGQRISRSRSSTSVLSSSPSVPAPSTTTTTCIALYSFQGLGARELSVSRGDCLKLRRQVDSNWVEVERNGQIGMVPITYVIINGGDADGAPHSIGGTIVRAAYDFQARNANELSLKKGEVLRLLRRIDFHWLEGRNIKGRIGIFPESYVQQHHTYTSNSNGSSLMLMAPNRPKTPKLKSPPPAPPHRREQLYRAIYPYRPARTDELELVEGEIINVVEKCDDGWFIGESLRSGAFGTFPGNYVVPV